MSELTEYGFNFGSMEITRVCSDEKASIVSVKTAKREVSIRATKAGVISFYGRNGKKLYLTEHKLEEK